MLLFAFLLRRGRGQLLKERICSSRSKFFPFRVNPVSKSYHIQGINASKYNTILGEKSLGIY